MTGGHGKSAKITLKMALPGLGFQSCPGKQAVPLYKQEQDEAWDVAACSSICHGSELFLHPVSTASSPLRSGTAGLASLQVAAGAVVHDCVRGREGSVVCAPFQLVAHGNWRL